MKEARVRAGMTIYELAERVGITPGAVSRYENGKRVPKIPIAKRIAQVLGVAWYEIIDTERSA